MGVQGGGEGEIKFLGDIVAGVSQMIVHFKAFRPIFRVCANRYKAAIGESLY